MTQQESPPPADRSSAPVHRPSLSSRYGWLLFPGLIALYFAMQIWILPKMGVPT